MENKKNVAVLGAGLIGMAVAAALIERGHKVTVIEKEDRVLPLYFDSETSLSIQEIFISRGAQILAGTEGTRSRRNRGEG